MFFNNLKLTFSKLFGSFSDRAKDFIKVSFILVILLIIFFYRTIFWGLYPSAADILAFWPLFRFDDVQIQNMLLTDIVVAFEPWFWLNYVSIQQLQIPLWNPYSAAGVPHMANMMSSVFFPLTWPIYILGPERVGLLLYYFTKLYLIGIFCYYYLRSIKLDSVSSVLGSIAFMFMGYNIGWLYYPASSTVFMLPASLYLIEKIIDSQSEKKYLFAFSIVTALEVFAGNPEGFFYIVVISFLYFVFRLIIEKKAELSAKIIILKNYIIFSLFGLVLGAVQLLPFLEYLVNSYAWVVRCNIRYMMDWHTAILNIIPAFYGSPSIHHKVPYCISFTNYNESAAGYVGITMLIFAAFTLITKYKDNLVRFYLLLSIWTVGVIYGIPLIFDFTVSLPLFSRALNTRLLFLLGFNVVVLGAIGLNKILAGVSEDKKRYILNRFVIAILIVLLVLFALAYTNCGFLFRLSSLNVAAILTQSLLVMLTCMVVLLTFILIYILVKYAHKPRLKTACIVALLLLIFAQTGGYGLFSEPAIEEKYYYPEVEAFDLINDRNELYRATSIDNFSSIYPANTQMAYRIYDIRNLDALGIRYYWELLNVFAEGRIHGWIDFFRVDKRFLDFTGVKWIFSRGDLSNDSCNITLFKKYEGFNLFENKDAQPRAFVVQNAIYMSRDSDIMNALRNMSFDWRSSVVISGQNHTVQYPSSENNVRIVKYEPAYIKILVNMTQPGFLVLSDSYYPGWNAYINGNRTEILRANYAFRAVALPNGENVVEFKYEPLSFYVGGLISLIGLLILIIAMQKSRRKVARKKR